VYQLPAVEKEWVMELERHLDTEISTTIHTAMASSGNTLVADTMVMIINIALITSRPLR
jgi:hypothetical protein